MTMERRGSVSHDVKALGATQARVALSQMPAREVAIGVDGLTMKRHIDRDTIRRQLPPSQLVKVKAAVVGEEGVGKTQGLVRWLGGVGAGGVEPSTVGVQTVNVTHFSDEVMREAKVTLWDMGGKPSYFEIRTEFYRDASNILLCFCTAARPSFAALATWKAEVMKASPDVSKLVVVGIHHPSLERQVGDDEAARWAQGLGVPYHEVNTATGDGSRALLNMLVLSNTPP